MNSKWRVSAQQPSPQLSRGTNSLYRTNGLLFGLMLNLPGLDMGHIWRIMFVTKFTSGSVTTVYRLIFRLHLYIYFFYSTFSHDSPVCSTVSWRTTRSNMLLSSASWPGRQSPPLILCLGPLELERQSLWLKLCIRYVLLNVWHN